MRNRSIEVSQRIKENEAIAQFLGNPVAERRWWGSVKASVQYNDYLGTAAADFADSSSLEDYLEWRGVDMERYWPVGVELNTGNDGFVSMGFICLDRERNDQAVKVCFESKDRLEDFIGLFKRLNVVLTWAKGGDRYAGLEPAAEPIYIDDRK